RTAAVALTETAAVGIAPGATRESAAIHPARRSGPRKSATTEGPRVARSGIRIRSILGYRTGTSQDEHRLLDGLVITVMIATAAAPVGGVIQLLEAEHFLDGDEAVGVAIVLAELLDRHVGVLPLVQGN